MRSVSNDVSQRPHSRPAEVTLAVSLSLSQSLIVVSCSPLRVVSCLLPPDPLTCVCCRCPRRRSADWSPPPSSLWTTNCRTSASSTSAPGLSRRATRVMIMRDLSSLTNLTLPSSDGHVLDVLGLGNDLQVADSPGQPREVHPAGQARLQVLKEGNLVLITDSNC